MTTFKSVVANYFARIKSVICYVFAKLRMMEFTLFNALLVVVASLQWCTLEKTNQTAKEAQRPWIDFDVPTHGDLVWGGDTLAMMVHFGLKNRGNSPALTVRGHSKTFLVWSDDEIRKTQDEICDQFDSVAGTRGYGTTIFPNNPPYDEVMLFEIGKTKLTNSKLHLLCFLDLSWSDVSAIPLAPIIRHMIQGLCI
jgi:hypothetical protein